MHISKQLVFISYLFCRLNDFITLHIKDQKDIKLELDVDGCSLNLQLGCQVDYNKILSREFLDRQHIIPGAVNVMNSGEPKTPSLMKVRK